MPYRENYSIIESRRKQYSWARWVIRVFRLLKRWRNRGADKKPFKLKWPPPPPPKTQIAIGNGTIQAGGDINISAPDNLYETSGAKYKKDCDMCGHSFKYALSSVFSKKTDPFAYIKCIHCGHDNLHHGRNLIKKSLT